MSELSHNNLSYSLPAGECAPPTRVSGAQGVVASLTRRRFLAASSSLFAVGTLGSLAGCADSTSATPAVNTKTPAELTSSPTAGVVTASDAPEVSDHNRRAIGQRDHAELQVAHFRRVAGRHDSGRWGRCQFCGRLCARCWCRGCGIRAAGQTSKRTDGKQARRCG